MLLQLEYDAFSPTNYDDLATDEIRGARHGSGKLTCISECVHYRKIENNISGSFGHPREVVCGRHTHKYHDAFETRLSSPAAKYPVRNGNDVCPKAMSTPPYRSLAPIHHGWKRGSDVQCIWESENRAKASGPWPSVPWRRRYCKLLLALAVRRWRAFPFAGPASGWHGAKLSALSEMNLRRTSLCWMQGASAR